MLLDTHILLWVMQDAPQLGRTARKRLADATQIHVSSVSLWEAAVKCRLGKLKLDLDALDDHLAQVEFTPLPVTWAHARRLRELPLLHADPFDRMLIAQAMTEPMHLLTHDAALAAYSELVVVV